MDHKCYTYMSSPVGRILLAGGDAGLSLIGFEREAGSLSPQSDWMPDESPFTETIRQLQDYFEGKLKRFSLPLAPEGTAFQLTVWRRLREIEWGRTITYAGLAAAIGKPKAARAVGSANGCNPLPIVVPCHRVIGSDGSLTGYGGGLHIKEFLLRLEGVIR